jgi:hypothetical protein
MSSHLTIAIADVTPVLSPNTTQPTSFTTTAAAPLTNLAPTTPLLSWLGTTGLPQGLPVSFQAKLEESHKIVALIGWHPIRSYSKSLAKIFLENLLNISIF